MTLSYQTKNVGIYAMVKDAKGEYQEAQGVGSLKWNLHISENKNEIHGITIEVPDQVIADVDMIYVDANGEHTIKTSIEIKDAKCSSKSVSLNQALLPTSVEIREESLVSFTANPNSIF